MEGKRIVLRPCNRGRNKRGIAAHKPKVARTKTAKKQYIPGGKPRPLTAYRMRFDKP